MDYELIIEGQLCDLPDPKEFGIKFTRQFVDLEKIEARSGDFTYNISLPKTATNNIIFRNANLVDSVGKFVRTADYTTTFRTKGNNTLIGIFKLTKISDSYEGILVSNEISWVKLLDGLNLNNLVNKDGTAWTFPFKGCGPANSANTFTNLISGNTFDNSDVQFPLIPRSYFYTTEQTVNNDGIYDDSLYTSDIPPAPFRLKVVKKIFEQIQWSVDGDVFAEPEQQTVVTPFCSAQNYKYNFKYLYDGSATGATYSAQWWDYPGGFAPARFANTWNWKIDLPSLPEGPGGSVTILDKRKVGFTYIHPNSGVTSQNNTLHPFPISYSSGGTLLSSNEYYNTGVYGGELCCDFSRTIGPNSGDTFYEFGGDSASGVYVTPQYNRPELQKGGLACYIWTSYEQEKEVLTNIAEYIWSEDVEAVVNNPYVVFYYDAWQSAISGTPFSFQPYDQDAEISLFPTDDFGYVKEQFAADKQRVYLTGGTLNLEMRNMSFDENTQLRWVWCAILPRFNNSFTTDYQGRSGFNLENLSIRYFAEPTKNTLDDVNIGENLPVVSCTSYLQDFLAATHSLISFNNDNKTIRFDTYNNFFLPNEFAYNLTVQCQLKNGEPDMLPIPIQKNIYFKYAEDGNDVLLNQDPTYGNLQITNDNVYSTGDNNVNSIFAATRTRTFYLYDNLLNPIELPTIMSVDALDAIQSGITWDFSSSNRILKIDGFYKDNLGSNFLIPVAGFPSPIMLSRFEDPRPGKLSLRWDDENGIYETYYARYLNDIADSHIVEYLTKIDAFDYSQLIPQKPVLIDKQHYFLYKIDGFAPVLNKQTKIQFIRKFTN